MSIKNIMGEVCLQCLPLKHFKFIVNSTENVFEIRIQLQNPSDLTPVDFHVCCLLIAVGDHFRNTLEWKIFLYSIYLIFQSLEFNERIVVHGDEDYKSNKMEEAFWHCHKNRLKHGWLTYFWEKIICLSKIKALNVIEKH